MTMRTFARPCGAAERRLAASMGDAGDSSEAEEARGADESAPSAQPSVRAGLAAIWRFADGEHANFALATGALVVSAVALYAAPLVPQSVFDLVAGDAAKASAISRFVIDALGGLERVGEALWIPAAAMIGIAIVSGIAIHLKTRFAAGAAERIARRLRDRMYDHVQRLPPATLDELPSGDIVQRCTSDIETTRAFCANQAPEIGRAVLMLVVPLPIMLLLDWRMALASIVCVPAMLAFTAIHFRRMAPSFAAKEAAEGRMTTNVTENLTGIRTVRAFGRAEHENARFTASSAAFRDADARLFRMFAAFWAKSDLICFLQQVVVVGLGAWLLARGSLELGAYFYFLTVVAMFIWPVRMLGRMVVEAGKALAAVARLEEILARSEERDLDPDASRARPLDVPALRPGASALQPGASALQSGASAMQPVAPARGLAVRFRDVRFAHRGGPTVLDGISFELEPGQTLGLVGPSGAGKTTIVQLLLRFHEPVAGSIEVDGRALRDVPRASIRGAVGTVLQQPFLYSRKLRDNIRASTRAADARMEDVETCAEIARVHETILSFPEGYDTVVGEKGMTLSGGQRQRIAIARALVAEPRLLVLDDALSAVDADTEASILAALRARRNGQTKIIVAHRLSAVMDADLILVLDEGRIIQRGTHAALVAQPGLYRTLWEIQNHAEAELDAAEEVAGV
jgi:ATP-binding cassette subfamily B protein